MEQTLGPDQIKAIWQRDPSTWTNDDKRQLVLGISQGFSGIGLAIQALSDSVRPAFAAFVSTAIDVLHPKHTFRAYARPQEWRRIATEARQRGDGHYAEAIFSELRKHKGSKWAGLDLRLNVAVLCWIADDAGVSPPIIVG